MLLVLVSVLGGSQRLALLFGVVGVDADELRSLLDLLSVFVYDVRTAGEFSDQRFGLVSAVDGVDCFDLYNFIKNV